MADLRKNVHFKTLCCSGLLGRMLDQTYQDQEFLDSLFSFKPRATRLQDIGRCPNPVTTAGHGHRGSASFNLW